MKTLFLLPLGLLAITGCSDVKPVPPEVQSYGAQTVKMPIELLFFPAASDSLMGNFNYTKKKERDC